MTVIKKPAGFEDVLVILGNYQAELQLAMENLEEKQAEEESETRQLKIDEFQNRIDLAENAIEALENLE